MSSFVRICPWLVVTRWRQIRVSSPQAQATSNRPPTCYFTRYSDGMGKSIDEQVVMDWEKYVGG